MLGARVSARFRANVCQISDGDRSTGLSLLMVEAAWKEDLTVLLCRSLLQSTVGGRRDTGGWGGGGEGQNKRQLYPQL